MVETEIQKKNADRYPNGDWQNETRFLYCKLKNETESVYARNKTVSSRANNKKWRLKPFHKIEIHYS